MYTLKSIAQRTTLLGATAALVVAAVVPAAAVFAAELNPLTERSLLLSSSAPGFIDTDGSNYSTANPNPGAVGNPGDSGYIPQTFAPAGSGPNGMKTGETFTFRVSSSSTIKGLSFQYCTSAAGYCQAPGNNNELVPGYTDGSANSAGDFRNGVYPTATDGRPDNTGPDGGHAAQKSDLDFVGSFAPALAAATPAAGEFQIYRKAAGGTLDPIDTTGWSFEKKNLESDLSTSSLTGKNNYVTVSSPTGITGVQAGDQIQVVFKASESTYITNPGAREFFVKINTYSNNGIDDMIGAQNDATPADMNDDAGHTVIDGGVTVANVMTDSIHITTKVLETMAFSVGTKNRDTMDIGGAGNTHGTCDPVLQDNNNRLQLGNENAEHSLEVAKAYDVNSYWRLSSNSSGGATVYYSGGTLANTVGDEIRDMPTETASTPGTEQFGLGFVDAGLDTMDSNPAVTWQNTDAATHKSLVRSYPFITLSTQTAGVYAPLLSQPASQGYDEATGLLDDGSGHAAPSGAAKFQFHKSSLTIPEPIAQQNEMVINCSTAKMRYVGNIAADTPAGVYTTKINYLAAPQY